MRFSKLINKSLLFILCLIFCVPCISFGSDPVKITDSAGNSLTFLQKPEKVVSLLPYVTEILYKFGDGKSITGLTKQDLAINPAATAVNIGSYFSPDLKKIIDCNPDLIIVAPSHQKIIDHFKDTKCRVIVVEVKKINDAFDLMKLLGKIFDRMPEAEKIIKSNQEKLALVKARADKIPQEKRKRVARVMAGKNISCPGNDSFQREMIINAGRPLTLSLFTDATIMKRQYGI